MRVLGIETTTRVGSVALAENGRVKGEADLKGELNHAEKLLPVIDSLLNKLRTNIDQIQRVAVSLGPGSFTGQRIGITVARVISQMREKEVVGVSTLDSLVFSLPGKERFICPLINAISGQVFCAFYSNEGGSWQRKSEYLMMTIPELCRQVNLKKSQVLFTGEGLFSHREELAHTLGDKAFFAPQIYWRPQAACVALMGERLKSLPWRKLLPLYIRPSEAELKWKEK